MIYVWIRGLVTRSPLRITGATTGIALAFALLASLGLFLASSSLSMTSRAVSGVPIDWQVEMVPTADARTIKDAIRKSALISALHQVDYAAVDGFVAQTGGTTQTTGPGKVITFDAGYAGAFPQELRLLAGTLDGPLVAQQTAANLHVSPGDTVTIKRPGLDPVNVVAAGVVDLPDADSLFQAVGLPRQAAPQAPPDNVLILPTTDWARLFSPQEKVRPDSIRRQFHVRLDRKQLPTDPDQAYQFVTGAVHNLETRVAGQALVGNNLGARLDAMRGDALYARVLFLFLGIPGIALAAIMTMTVTSTNADRRRRERALLRVRGASLGQVVRAAGAEAAICAIAGIALGLGITAAFAMARGSGTLAPDWVTVALSCGLALVLAFAAILLPAIRETRELTVMATRDFVPKRRPPLWERTYADIALITLSGLFFWQVASTGYQIVLAPEGVAATAVDYKAFISPALFWAGSMLLAFRVARLIVDRGRKAIAKAVRPISGSLAPAITASLAHQSRRLAFGVAMLALAVSFAVSTSIFNTTYNAQSRVDAELTNGADVTVFGTTNAPAGAHLKALAKLPGVVAAVPMQHRFAYVGADLQDLFGIDPTTIGEGTHLSDAYFSRATAAQVLKALHTTPDGVLVSQETVKDFQLTQGDTINLRLMSATDHQYHPVAFHFVGVAREFPTAPKDSFLVANSTYIAKMTGNSAQEYVLMKSSGDPAVVARSASKLLAGTPALKVKDIGEATRIIGSNLTAVDLHGLTRIELTFAAIMAAAASGLLLLLGLFERRRAFAVLNVIGARPGQLAAFIWSEGLVVLTGGLFFGMTAGLMTAWMLVKLLTGVFDPPPQSLVWPFGYLAMIIAFVVASSAVALAITSRTAAGPSAALLRDT